MWKGSSIHHLFLLRVHFYASEMPLCIWHALTLPVSRRQWLTEIVPSENLIRTILRTLDQTDKEPLSVRNAVYDSSMGSCLHALHSSCSDDVVRFVAGDLVSVFPQALQSTESLELKGAMCSAYIRVAKTCPPMHLEAGTSD
ncbi:non-specific serine/threonine protein kinase [Ranunculus cassubicifolius]